ncbi:MAG: class IV adenylate cyclase [Candidatus Pacebacteria bacterium]|nr:class IV adenylate cyclase [Candidatus Paceibacterota bacterium]
MIEVEIRAKINHKSQVQDKLKQAGATLVKSINQADRIFGHEMFLDEKKMIVEGGLSARIRQVDGKAWLEFKEISRNKGAGIEIKADLDNIEEGLRFFEKLGFEEAFALNKQREVYSLNGFEICLDEVEKLGNFIEIEKSALSQDEIEAAKQECLELLEKVSPESEIINKKYGDLMQEILNKK